MRIAFPSLIEVTLAFSCLSPQAFTAEAPVLTPTRFDVRANDLADDGVPVVTPWKTVVLDPEYRGAWMVAGDVNGDGEVEVVSARNHSHKDVHYTCSVVVHRLDGSVLWRWGNADEGRNQLHHDVACQIYDWDGNHTNDVIVATKQHVIELDGATGCEKRRFAIPPESSDCIVFCNLSGGDRATDLLVKTRYTDIWAFNRDGKQLWHTKMPGGYRTAHQPRPIDIDGDGRDEIITGFSMLNADGTLRWALDKEHAVFEYGKRLSAGHLDCARLLRRGPSPADSSLVITFCGGDRMTLINGEGLIRWGVAGHHFESVNIGKVCPDLPGQQMIVDEAHRPRGEQPLWLFDESGTPLGRIVTDGSRHHLLIDWFGHGVDSIMIAQPRALFDGHGKKTARFETPMPEAETAETAGRKVNWLCAAGDMTGDGIPDLVLSTNPGARVYIYKNGLGKKLAGEVPLGTGINYTLY